MGKAAKLARTGQGVNITRGEGSGAKISRGTNRGRPLDVAKDAREGDFLPLGPHAARRVAKPITQAPVGTDTAQADNIDGAPSGMLRRSEPGFVRRKISDGTMILTSEPRPANQLWSNMPTPFPEPTPVARVAPVESDGSSDTAGISFGTAKRFTA